MFDILTFNSYEYCLFGIAIGLLIYHYRRANYKPHQMLLWLLLLLPVLYFSINMVTEAVTVDEPQYEECITDIRNLKNYSAAEKVLYEYKFTQLTIGSVFWFLSDKTRVLLGANNIWKIYKCLHWLLMFAFSLLTTSVWRKDILDKRSEKKMHILENLVLIVLIGLPLTCSLMKVTNYDASSTYPAILGLSMMWAAYSKSDNKLGFWATVVTALGVLDKWTALPYWIIVVILYSLLKMRSRSKVWERIGSACLSVAMAYVVAIVISALYFFYADLQQGGFCRDIDIGVVVFSFVHAIKGIITGNLSVDSSPQDVMYIPILYIIMVAGSIFVYGLFGFLALCRKEVTSILLKIDGMLMLIGIWGGMIGAYFIPLRIAPFMEIESGCFISRDSFGGWTYHFGAKTAIGHFGAKICYEWATIVANYPTIIVFFLIFIGILLIRKYHSEEMLICSLVLSATITLLVFYAIAGYPSDARYYSYPMIVILLAGIYIGDAYITENTFKKGIIIVGYVLYVLEMCLYIPNVKSFSPMWLVHDRKHNESVRIGQQYAGEVMFWGEQVALAGNLIEEMEGTDNCENVIVYSDYSLCWPGNPGYVITSLNDKSKEELRFDEDAYYVINKFWIFRSQVPDYIREVSPIATLSFKGEVGAWIFRGDQLINWSEKFIDK